MNRHLSVLLAGPSLFVLATAAVAQPATTTPPTETKTADEATQAQQANEATSGSDETTIVITARRRAESLLDVPQTVNAVSGEEVKQFNILKFTDIQQLVPGLSLINRPDGFTTIAQTRGVSFDRSSQTSVGTVEMYLNEVSVEPNLIFSGNFDIGQFETLKGPQGTLRGRSSPSGAILMSTRRPDLDEAGGYVNFTGNNHGGLNGQAAVGLPIIKDVLAVRIAGLIDENDAGGIKSVNNPSDPYNRTWAGRATVRFEPASNFSAVVMYQHLKARTQQYGSILFGPGTIGWSDPTSICTGTVATHPVGSICPATGSNPAVFAPANFNGPPLTGDQRKAVADFPNITRQTMNALTGQIEWRFAGQKLSYVGGWSKYVLDSSGGGGDASNTIVGHNSGVLAGNVATDKRIQQELRLSSDERIAGIFDYTVGGFYEDDTGSTFNTVVLSMFPGAFGSPIGTTPIGPAGAGLLSPFNYDPRYEGRMTISGPHKDVEKSIFAHVLGHVLNDKLELEGGVRHIWWAATKAVDLSTSSALQAFRNPNASVGNPNAACPATFTSVTGNPLFPSSAVGLPLTNAPLAGSTYPGTCDYLLTPGNGIAPLGLIPIPKGTRHFKAWVYKLGASYHITRDLMVYANYGTSWRPGPGPITALATCSDPAVCQQFNILSSEKSKGLELGFKGSFFDRRLALSVAAYRQKYDGLINFTGTGTTPFLSNACPNLGPGHVYVTGDFAAFPRCAVGTSQFSFNAPAIIKGIDIDLSLRISDDLNVGSGFSYSKGRYDNAQIPCRDELINATGLPGMDQIADNGTQLGTPAAWLNAGGPRGPALCNSNGTTTTAPPWNVNARAEYSHEMFTGGKAFIRTLFNYTPRNKNAVASGYIPKAYAILNLWLGLRGQKGDWEVSFSAHNILNNKTVLTQGLQPLGLTSPQRFGATPATFAPVIPGSQSGNSGYTTISYVDRREFAVNFRYSFGSR